MRPIWISILFGVLISAWPHFVQFFQNGHVFWIADTDELELYLLTASQAFFNHLFTLSDPLFETVKPTVFPWIQLGPSIVLAKTLGLSPDAIGFIWRLIAGASAGAAWYWLYASVLKERWTSLFASLFTMSDTGLLFVKPVLLQISHLLSDQQLSHPMLQTQWRIISPGLSLPFLLVYLRLLIAAREGHRMLGKSAVIWAGIAFGVLFYVYFYFWTAVLCGLIFSWLADRTFRSTYLKIATIGIIIGIPKIIADFMMQASSAAGWSLRSDKFVPIDRFSELMINKGALVFLAIMIFIAWRRRHELKSIVLHAIAGLLLLNHQIISGLQIENFHWIYFFGPVLFFASLTGIVGLIPRTRWALIVGGGLAALTLVSGVWLRHVECFKSAMPSKIAQTRTDFLDQKVPSLDPNGIVAGDTSFVSLASLLKNQRPLAGYSAVLSPNISTGEWHEREALNGYLDGSNREEFEKRQLEALANPGWGPWGRDLEVQKAAIQQRLTIYDDVAKNLLTYIKRFSIRYVGVRLDKNPPTELSSIGREIQNGPHWRIFEISP